MYSFIHTNDMNAKEKSEAVLSCVFPDLVPRWRRVVQDMKEIYRCEILATSGLRSVAAQWGLYEKGRKRQPNGEWMIIDPREVVTHSVPLRSFHNYGLAIDACFSGQDPYLEKIEPKERADFLWSEYGRFAKAHGFEWGGDWKFHPDRPHIQMRYGMSLDQIQELFEFGGLKSVHYRCNQILNNPGYLSTGGVK